MNIMGELAIIFGLCLVSEGISALLPVPFPASVISMVLLLLLLLAGAVKETHIGRACKFFVDHMAFFFIPPCVGILEYFDVLSSCLVPFLVIAAFTTPLVYGVTAWVIQLLMRLRKEAGHD